jgi:hypothetical protein
MPEVFKLFGSLVADATEFSRGLRAADTELKDFDKKFEASQKKRDKFAQQSALLQQKLAAQTSTAQAKLAQQAAQFEIKTQLQSETAFRKTELAKQKMAQQTALTRERLAQQAAQFEIRQAERAANKIEAEARRAAKSKGGKTDFLGVSSSDVLSASVLYAGGRAVEAAIDKTKEAENANRALTSSATEAGKAYSVLAKEALQFGKDAGISNVEAQRAAAELQKVLTLAGKANEFSKYSKGFLDVAAAKGQDFQSLRGLFSGIMSGEDEVINRYGKPNPGVLKEQYAERIGKQASDLTQQEEILSRLTAFEKDFELFAGKNEERLKTTSGAADQAAMAVKNIGDNFSQAAVQSMEFRGALQLVNDVLNSIKGFDPITVRIRLQQGESPKKLAEEASNTWGNWVMDRVTALASGIPAVPVLGYDVLTGNDQAWQNFQGAVQPDLINKRRREEYEAEFTKMQEGLNAQEKESDFQRAQNSVNTYLGWQKQQLDGLKKEAKQAVKDYQLDIKLADDNLGKLQGTLAAVRKDSLLDPNAKATLVDTLEDKIKLANDKLQREVERLGKLTQDFNRFRAGARADISDNRYQKMAIDGKQAAEDAFEKYKDLGVTKANEAADAIRQVYRKKIADAFKQQMQDVRGSFASLSDNPYVRIFADARSAAEQAIESTEGLNSSIRQALLSATQGASARALFNARVETAQNGVALKYQANAILFPNPYSEELDQRRLSQAINSNDYETRLSAQAELYDRNQTTNFIRDQYYATQRVEGTDDQRNSAIAALASKFNPQDIPNDLRGIFYNALIKESAKESNFEKDAIAELKAITALIGQMGLKVDLGGQAITQIEVTSEKLAVKGVSLPSRGSGGIASFRDGSSVRSATTLSNPFIKK